MSPAPGFRGREGASVGRRYGQHFLRNAKAIGTILERFAARKEDFVVEIGAGRGALTRPLALSAGALAALEIDAELAARLAAELGCPLLAFEGPAPASETRLCILRGDALSLGYEIPHRLLRAPSGTRLRVIGNLPFGVATTLIRRVLAQRALVSDALVMVQAEVAERLLAAPGCKAYGPISVLLSGAAQRAKVLTLPPGAFRPPPGVRATVLSLGFSLPGPGEIEREGRLERLLHAAFSSRRKKLASNLARRYALDAPMVEELLREAGVDPGARAEQVDPPSFGRLVDRMSGRVPELGFAPIDDPLGE
jgi:16S rRNA (adenine1518-N6/adenine1519-N6)-dimethyltransferase